MKKILHWLDENLEEFILVIFLCIKMNWNENNVEILHNKGETEECIEF